MSINPIVVAAIPLAAIAGLLFFNRKRTQKPPPNTTVTPSPPVGGGDKDTAGKSANEKPEETKPSHDHDNRGVLQTVLVLSLLAAVVLVCFSRCERMAEHRAVAKAIDRESAADPDNWFWELWKVGPDGRMHQLATGITRKTVEIDGKTTVVYLSWRGDVLNGQITATAKVGEKGHWEVINGQGRQIKRDFGIYTVSNTEIRGYLDDLDEKYDCVFRRSSYRKWN